MPPPNPALARHSSDYTPGSPNRLTHCRIEGCDREHRARGLCHKHYQAWRLLRPEARARRRRSNAAGQQRRRGTKYDLGRCEECGGVFTVMPNGAFRGRPHLNAAGSQCRGWDLPVSVIVAAAS